MKKTWLTLCIIAVIAGAAWAERENVPFLRNFAGETSPNAVAAAGDTPQQGGHGKRGGNSGPAAVKTVAVIKTKLPADVSATGWADAKNTTTIAAQESGLVTSVVAHDGAMVKKGDLIVTLDDRTAKAAVDKDQAMLDRDNATLAEAETALKRAQSLLNGAAGSQQTVDQATEARDTAAATVNADKAQLASDQVLLDHTQIRAPFNGRLGDISLSEGAYVGPGTAIVTIADYDPIYIKFHMPENYLHQLKRALAAGPVMVSTVPRSQKVDPKQGQIAFYDNTVDSASGTILVKASFANAEGTLWPGQSINVIVHFNDEEPQIVVPTVAVNPGPDGFYAFVVGPDKKVSQKPVTVARANGDRTAISSGLSEGDHVVVEGQLQLRDGATVNEQFTQDASQKVADADIPHAKTDNVTTGAAQ